jgi:hypothetical protein
MTKLRIQAIEYDENVEIAAEENFATAKEAVEWCEARRGAKIQWGDTEFGYTSEWGEDPPAKFYEIHGVNEKGEVDYLEEGDHEAF